MIIAHLVNRFWYKPTISREEAISLLRTQSPGTFIVRDSNSFPGAFGLALKVSTPPQNNNNKTPSDPHSELVRHFLIEPTSKGVKLKGRIWWYSVSGVYFSHGQSYRISNFVPNRSDYFHVQTTNYLTHRKKNYLTLFIGWLKLADKLWFSYADNELTY